MVVVSLKNNEVQFLLDAILEKNISTLSYYIVAKTTLEKLVTQLDNVELAKQYSDNFYKINSKWTIENFIE